jgi:hypothetical protein
MAYDGTAETPGRTLLNEATRLVISKNYETSLAKIKQAIDMDTPMTSEDLGVLDHVYGHFSGKAKTDEAKIKLFYVWVETIDRIWKEPLESVANTLSDELLLLLSHDWTNSESIK